MARTHESTVTGVRGRIVWHYYTAADVCAFTLTCDREHRWTVAGTVVNANPFKMAQSPRTFVVPTRFGEWRWPIVTDALHAHEWIARLGPRARHVRPQEAHVTEPARYAPNRAALYLRGGLDRREA